MKHPDVRRAHHHAIHLPAGTASFSPDALRRILATTEVTSAAHFVEGGRSAEDYRSSVFMYFERFIDEGDLHDLAKAVLKAVSLREFSKAPGNGS